MKGKSECFKCNYFADNQQYVLEDLIRTKYETNFLFFLTQSVNLMISEKKGDKFVNKYKDNNYFDDDNEFLKRIYKKSEVQKRMIGLKGFYQYVLPECSPNL